MENTVPEELRKRLSLDDMIAFIYRDSFVEIKI